MNIQNDITNVRQFTINLMIVSHKIRNVIIIIIMMKEKLQQWLPN